MFQRVLITALLGAVLASAQETDTAAHAVAAPVAIVDTAVAAEVPVVKSVAAPVSDLDAIRAEAAALRAEAEKLREAADRLNRESKDLDRNKDDLESRVERLEEQAEGIGERAKSVDDDLLYRKELLKLAQEDTVLKTVTDSSLLFTDKAVADRTMLMLHMRNESDEMLMKAHDLSKKLRGIEESIDKKEDIADRLDDKSDDLEDKADDLDEEIERVAEARDHTPFGLRNHRIRVGYEWRGTTVPPYGDMQPHLLMFHGFDLQIRPLLIGSAALGIGFDALTLHSINTIAGNRYAIGADPLVSISFYPVKRIELSGSIGAAVQGQWGSDKETMSSVAPFVKLSGNAWISKHVSMGPIIRLSGLAHGDAFTHSLHPDNVLPSGALWIDGGLNISCSF